MERNITYYKNLLNQKKQEEEQKLIASTAPIFAILDDFLDKNILKVSSGGTLSTSIDANHFLPYGVELDVFCSVIERVAIGRGLMFSRDGNYVNLGVTL